MRLSANGMPSASAAARLSFSGFQAGKEYTVSFAGTMRLLMNP